MQIITYCGCGQSFSVDDSLLGSTMQCPTCQQFFTVQAAAPPSQPISPQPPNQQPFATDANHLQNRYAHPSAGYPPAQPIPQPVAQPVQQPVAQPVQQPTQPELMPLSPLPDQVGQTPASSYAGASSEPHTALSSNQGPSKKKLWLGLGVGLGGAAGLILLLLLLIGQFVGGGGRYIDLSYLPGQMSQFFYCDVEGLLKTESGKSMIDQGFLVRQHFGSVERALQIDLEDIRTITVGYVGNDPSDSVRPFNLRSKRPTINFSFRSFFNFCAVIRTKEEVDSEEVMAGLPTYVEKQHEGNTYYCNKKSPAYAFAFPESDVILFGTEPEIQQALGGSKGVSTSMFGSIRKSDQVVFINSMGVDFATGAEQTGIGITYGNEVTGRLWIEMPSAEQARRVVQAQREMQRMIRNLPDNPALRKAKASGFMSGADPFGLGDATASGKIVTTEFSGRDKLVTTAVSEQAVVGMLRPFAQFGNRNFTKTPIKNEPAKQQPPKQPNNPRKKTPVPKSLGSFPRYSAGAGNKVDLLEVINPEKDQIQGNWSFDNQTLVNGSNTFRPRIQFPYKPPVEYDIKVSFRQTQPSGTTSIMIPNNNGRSFSWTMDQTGKCGFTVNPIKKNPTNVQVKELIRPNVIHTLIIQKRANVVRAVFDGRVLAEYKGPWADLHENLRTRLKNPELIGFHCETRTAINQIELIEVTGSGTFVD